MASMHPAPVIDCRQLDVCLFVRENPLIVRPTHIGQSPCHIAHSGRAIQGVVSLASVSRRAGGMSPSAVCSKDIGVLLSRERGAKQRHRLIRKGDSSMSIPDQPRPESPLRYRDHLPGRQTSSCTHQPALPTSTVACAPKASGMVTNPVGRASFQQASASSCCVEQRNVGLRHCIQLAMPERAPAPHEIIGEALVGCSVSLSPTRLSA